MDGRERGTHARGVSPTQYTSRMGTARVKQGASKNNNKSSKKSERKERG